MSLVGCSGGAGSGILDLKGIPFEPIAGRAKPVAGPVPGIVEPPEFNLEAKPFPIPAPGRHDTAGACGCGGRVDS